MILAADHVRDAHLDVVHHVHQMKYRLAVGTNDYEVGIGLLAVGQLTHHVAGHQIGDRHRLTGHAELNRPLMLVRQILVEQFLNPALINLAALGLKIRPTIAPALLHRIARDWPFIPIQPKPPQAVEDHVDRFARVAGVVRVLHAQDERAAGVAGIKPVEQRRTGAADVKIASRAGGKTNSNTHEKNGSEKPARTLPATPPPGKPARQRGDRTKLLQTKTDE